MLTHLGRLPALLPRLTRAESVFVGATAFKRVNQHVRKRRMTFGTRRGGRPRIGPLRFCLCHHRAGRRPTGASAAAVGMRERSGSALEAVSWMTRVLAVRQVLPQEASRVRPPDVFVVSLLSAFALPSPAGRAPASAAGRQPHHRRADLAFPRPGRRLLSSPAPRRSRFRRPPRRDRTCAPLTRLSPPRSGPRPTNCTPSEENDRCLERHERHVDPSSALHLLEAPCP